MVWLVGQQYCLSLYLLLCFACQWWPSPAVEHHCIHDAVQPRDVVTARQDYSSHPAGQDDSRGRRRRALEDAYRPMRVHVHYSDMTLEPEEQVRLKNIIRQTTTKISNILSVIPVEGKLLLRRSKRTCRSVFLTGINKDKCASIGDRYIETCLDNFKIPPEHLAGLYLYNYSHPEPIEVVFPQGAGVENSDYILYVRSISTQKCFSAGQNIIAYAAYCQVDQNDRPVAGYINICPQLLKAHSTDEKILIIALHEFFHALGFTVELFDKFRDCSRLRPEETLESCPRWRKPVRDVLGSRRLVTENLVKVASKHYGCSTHRDSNEFAPRLDVRNNKVGSHWDAAFLQGSLMAPNIGLPELTKLDMMTLTAFADMGWYKVNFDFADDYVWGQGEGCSFSDSSQCHQNTDFFCQRSDPPDDTILRGCHHLHQHKGFCDTDIFLRTCAIYEATSQGNCRDTANQKHAVDDEKFQPDSRCFVANLTKDMTMGSSVEPLARCYKHQCVEGRLQVKIGEAPWTDCPFGETTQIPGYRGVVHCPREGVLCLPYRPTPVITELPRPTTPTTSPPPVPHYDPDAETYNINISFPEVNYAWLQAEKALPLFKERVKGVIAMHTSISYQRMINLEVHRWPTVTFSFSLLPSLYADDGPSSEEVYSHLKRIVDDGKLTVSVTEGGKVFTATHINQRVGGPTYSSSALPAGVIAGMALGSLLAALVLGAVVLIIQRYYAVRTRILPNHARNATSNSAVAAAAAAAAAHDAQALASRQMAPAMVEPEQDIEWNHQRARSVLSASDVHIDDTLSFSDFSDTP